MKIAFIEDDNADVIRIKELITKSFPKSNLVYFIYLADFLRTDESYDLVLTDLRLPDEYGPSVISRIRQVTGKPIIVLSGVGGAELPKAILTTLDQAGATIFLSKYQDGFERLTDAIKSFL